MDAKILTAEQAQVELRRRGLPRLDEPNDRTYYLPTKQQLADYNHLQEQFLQCNPFGRLDLRHRPNYRIDCDDYALSYCINARLYFANSEIDAESVAIWPMYYVPNGEGIPHVIAVALCDDGKIRFYEAEARHGYIRELELSTGEVRTAYKIGF